MTYSIQKADTVYHRNLLLDLWQRNFTDVLMKRYSWIYENNPEGKAVVFLLKHEESDTFVGALAMFPRYFFVQGEKQKAYICGDLVVDKLHRMLGPATSLFKAAIQHCHDESPCLIITVPNNKSGPVAKRSGFKVIGQYVTMTKIIRTKSYIERYLRSSLASHVLSFPLDGFLRLYRQLLFFQSKSEYDFQVVDTFDSRFDDFWDTISDKFDFIGERTASYLNWRIKKSPYSHNLIFVMLFDNNIVGYVGFYKRDKRCYVLDIFTNDSCGNLQTLLSVFSNYQFSLGTKSITIKIAGHGLLIEQYKKNGFFVRNEEDEFVAYASPSVSDLISSIRRGVWYLTSIDTDI